MMTIRGDSGYSPFRTKMNKPPKLEFVEMQWRVVGPSGKPIVCGVYDTAAGLEVRCHLAESVDALIRSERATDIDIARDVAGAWKQAAIDKGFTEVTSDS
jgi:hypothetical protein